LDLAGTKATALIEFLVSECRRQGGTIHLLSVVTAIDESRGRIAAYCHDGAIHDADAAIVTVPLPILREIKLPHAVREKVTASTDIGYGNVVKILLRFTTKWWINCSGAILATCRSCSLAQRFPPGGRSIRPNIQCSPAGSLDPKPTPSRDTP
jgi:Flavin containing amine oxidoreductase